MRNQSGLESVDNALQLLLLLASRDSVRVSEIASELEIAPSSAHRLLSTLKSRGFASQGADRTYQRGPAFEQLGGLAVPRRPLAEVALPHLKALRDAVDETAHLSVLDGMQTHFVTSVECTQGLRVGSRAGARLPAHHTSGGKALLAMLSPAELDRRFPASGVPAADLSAEDVAHLRRQLDNVRRLGYGINRAESERGIAAIGTAIFGPGRHPVGAVSISVPSVRFSSARMQDLLLHLRHCKTEIEAELME